MDDVWKNLTLLIALLVAWIGLQQWWINREKLRLDLFSRRHAVFDSARKFIATIVQKANFDPEDQSDFWNGTADAGFLFHSEVTDYIALIQEKSIKLHYHLVSQKARDAKHGEHIEAEGKLMFWFAKQLRDDGLSQVFSRYLRFQDLQGPLTSLLYRIASSVRRIRLKRG